MLNRLLGTDMISPLAKKIIVTIGLLSLSSVTLSAKTDNKLALKSVDIAGKQRMLSQRIAKDYLYMYKNIASTKTKKELDASLVEFANKHKELHSLIQEDDIHNLLAFVELSYEELQETIKKPFSIDNAQLVLDLSESMLEGNQYVVNSLKKMIDSKESSVVAISGKQRMLSQRIGKYYIAYQLGIKDKNTIESMNNSVNEFNKNLIFLLNNKDNSPLIEKKLKKVNRLWKIVYKFYQNIEKGGLPLIVFNTTNKMTKQMDEITHHYVELKTKR